MSGSGWLGTVKSRAKSLQETAKNRIEKLSDTLDKKIKEAQEDLEKQRAAEASGSVASKVRRWTPSADHPDGQISVEAKPTPPPTPIQKPVVPSPSIESPSVEPTPEPQQVPAPETQTPVDEPIVIPRKKRAARKTEHKSSSLEESGNYEEPVQKLSNKLSEQIPKVDELTENTIDMAIPPKEESISIQDSTSHSENNINIEKEDARPSTTEADQEVVLIPRKKRAARKTEHKSSSLEESGNYEEPVQNLSNKLSEQIPKVDELTENTIDMAIPPKEESISIQDSTSHSENNINIEKEDARPSKIEADQEVVLIPRKKRAARKTEHKSSSLEESGNYEEPVQNLSNKLSEQIPKVDELTENTTDIAMPSKKESISIQDSTSHSENNINIEKEDARPSKIEADQEVVLTNIPTVASIPSTTIDHSSSNDIPIETPRDEQITLTNTNDLPIEHSSQENISIAKSNDEQPAVTSIDNLPVEYSDQEDILVNKSNDEQPVVTSIDNLSVEYSDHEDIPIDKAEDEHPAVTSIDNLPVEYSDHEDIPIDKAEDEHPAVASIDNLPVEYSDQEDVFLNKSSDEQPASTNVDNLSVEYSDHEDVPIDKSDDEQPAVTNINNSSIKYSDQEDILVNKSSDEQPAVASIDNLPIEYSDHEDVPINKPSDEQPAVASIDNLPVEYSDQEDVLLNKSSDEQPASTNADNLSVEYSDHEDVPIDKSDDEQPAVTNIDNSPIKYSDQEDILVNKSSDEQPAVIDTNDSLTVDSRSENVPIDEPANELTTSTNIEDSTVEQFDLGNLKNKIPDDEPTVLPIEHPNSEDTQFTATNIDDTPKEHVGLEDISQDTSDDEILTVTNIIDQENRQIEMPDGKLSPSSDIVDVPVVDFNPKSILQDIANDDLLASTESDNLPTEYLNSENVETETPDDESPQVYADSENASQDIPNDELLVTIKSDGSLVEQFHSENKQTENLDNELSVLPDIADLPTVDFNQENIFQCIPADELLASTDSDRSSTRSSRSDDEMPTTADIIDAINILMNIPDDKLPDSTKIDNQSHTDPDSTNILMNIPDNELPTIEDNVDSPPTNIQTKSNDVIQLEIRPDSNSLLMNIPDDALPTIEDIVDIPTVTSDAANILMNIPDDDLPTIENSKSKSSPKETKDKKSSTTTPVEPPKVQEIAQTPIKQPASNKDHPETPPNEFEDSFEDLKTTNIPAHPVPEKPTQEPTNLTALRTMISHLVDNNDDDDDFMSSKKDTSILPKNINTAPEQVNPPNILKVSLSLSLTSLSDETLDDVFNDTPTPVKTLDDEPPIEETYEIVPAMSVEPKPTEPERLPIVNNQSIPPGTKIQHINCSSTYIYFCTPERKIFYAKLNSNNFDSPLKWQQHSDLAEQLVVSVSNQTVWRLHNKILYSANDPTKYPPIGSQWNKIKLDDNQPLLSMSINDQCGWFIKQDGTLWLLRTDDPNCQSINVLCPFNLNTVFCFSEKVGVCTSDGEMLIRAGCTQDAPEGGGWIFIDNNFGPIDDFVLFTNSNILAIMDKKHRFWVHQLLSEKGFYQVLCDDDLLLSKQRYLISVNSELLCLTDCTKQMHIFSDTLIGVQWTVIENGTRLQRLIGSFANEDFVWALTTDRRVTSSNGRVLEKPRQAQFITHATFVPRNSSQEPILWSLDESCGIYVRADVNDGTEWEQANQVQFEWNRRLINIVCSNSGVWAVDDEGCIYFRHGHISGNQNIGSSGSTILPPAWISVPGKPARNRSFTQVYCGPADWMVYATDNKQNVYTREGINEENRIGTLWRAIEDCSALELAISERTLWLLTSCGEIQCRENISLTNPIGTRATTLSGFFLSLSVSMDDSQVWALDSKRNLLKLDRLTVLFQK